MSLSWRNELQRFVGKEEKNQKKEKRREGIKEK